MQSVCSVRPHYKCSLPFFLPVPSPSLSLFFDTDCIFAGTARFSLSCSLELDENVDTPILAQVQWLPNSIFSNSRVTVEFASQIVDTAFYTSRLVFDPLLFADSINYTCSGLFEPRDDDASNYVDDSGSSDSSDYDSTGVSIYVDASGSVQDSIQLNVEGRTELIYYCNWKRCSFMSEMFSAISYSSSYHSRNKSSRVPQNSKCSSLQSVYCHL